VLVTKECTEKQVEALKLKAVGLGVRRIARVLGISTAAAKGRLDGAELNICRALRCPSPGCPEILSVNADSNTLRCQMHGPMRELL
jgi:hypothetical protein